MAAVLMDASGIKSTARYVGQSLGVALLAVIFDLYPNQSIGVALTVAAVLAASGILPSAMRRAEIATAADIRVPVG